MFIMLDIRAEIKSYIAREGTSMNKVIDELNKKKSITTKVSNISLKMKKGTITFNEAQYIFDQLGYKFTIERK